MDNEQLPIASSASTHSEERSQDPLWPKELLKYLTRCTSGHSFPCSSMSGVDNQMLMGARHASKWVKLGDVSTENWRTFASSKGGRCYSALDHCSQIWKLPDFWMSAKEFFFFFRALGQKISTCHHMQPLPWGVSLDFRQLIPHCSIHKIDSLS